MPIDDDKYFSLFNDKRNKTWYEYLIKPKLEEILDNKVKEQQENYMKKRQ